MKGQRGASEGPVVLITGGAGFLGRALVQQLLEPGAVLSPAELRLLDLAPWEGVADERLVPLRGDVRSIDDLRRATAGVDVVLHCAALIDWGQHPEELVSSINLGGTRAVIRACQEAGVRALVHTSTLDVIYGGEPICDADESWPIPERPVNVYCRSKALGERAALAANGLRRRGRPDEEDPRLRTTVLRPCCIWGEGDPYHASSLIELGRKGPILRVGDGSARCQHVYVGNVAHAHLLAARALLEGQDGVAGEVFFVTDFPAKNFFDYMEPIVAGAGFWMVPRSLSLPRPLMYRLGAAMEVAARLLAPVYRFTPIISRFGVNFVCLDYTVTTSKAAERLGYAPRTTEEQAFAKTIAFFREREASTAA